MDVYKATIKRRAIRRFQNKPVPYDVLEKCVDAARMAPNGHNHQILEFIVVNDEEKLSDVLACFGSPRDPLDIWDMPSPGQVSQSLYYYPVKCRPRG